MATHNHKPTTLDDLAVMINGGFTTMQEQIDDVKGTMKDMAEELNATLEDVRYLRRSADMLVRNDAAQDAAITPSTTDPSARTAA
jgi:type II secretory pathway component PulM